MRIRLVLAIALSALVSAASTVSAAPIYGTLIPWSGSVFIQGFTGEIFGALRGPEDLLLPANALPSGSLTLDATLPGEIAYLGLGGIQGTINVGKVVKPDLPIADLLQMKLAVQVSFTSEIVELPAVFSIEQAPPQGALLIAFPEPGSFSLWVVSAGAVMTANRRRRGRSRCLAVSS